MNASKKLVIALAVLAASTSTFAQTVAPTATSSGLLGHRYLEVGAGYNDIRRSPINAIAGGAALNVPLNSSFDLGIDYAHGWLDNGDNVADSVGFNVTSYYASSEQLKQFANVSLGYVWNEGDNHSVWGARLGAEYTATRRFAYNASVGYDDDFRRGNNGLWDGEVKAIYAFTEKLSATASFTFIEGGNRVWGLSGVFKF